MADGSNPAPPAVEAALPVPAHHRPIRSFVRREGRMTDAQKDALDRLSALYSLDFIEGPFDFSRIFGRTAPVTLEIGFGNGDALIARTQSRPQHHHIGAEVHRPGVGHVLIAAERLGLENLRVISTDAVEVLKTQVPEASLSEVVIEFPDPWHKTRHHKRRLVQPDFAALLVRRLAPGGILRLATDWEHYALHMLAVLNAEPGLVNAAPDGRFVPRPESRPKTRFEKRGERLGHTVFDLEFRRR